MCAAFNPDVQDLQGEWGRESKPISQKEGDRSSAVALAGIGNTLQGAVNLADTAVKDYLKENVRNDVELERDKFTNAINLGLDIQYGKINPTAETVERYFPQGFEGPVPPQQGPLNILDQGAKVPSALQDLPSTVGAIHNAREARKIPDVYYQAQLSSIAKSYRSRFPGYADYIDSIVSNVTGMDPANAYIKSVLGLLQAAQQGAQDETKSTLALLDKNIGLPNAPQVREAFLNGGIDPETGRPVDGNSVRRFINKYEVQEWNSKETARRVQDLNNNDTLRKVIAEKRVQELGSQISNKYLSNWELAGGQTVEQFVNDPNIINNPKRMAELIPAIQNVKQIALRDFDRTVNDPYEKGKLGSLAIDTGTKVGDYRKQVVEVFDDIIDALNKGQANKASVLANSVKAAGDTATMNLLEYPGLKVPMEIMLAAKNMPDQMGNQFYSLLVGNYKQFGAEMGNYVNLKIKDLVTQPKLQTEGKASTVLDVVQEMKQKGVASKQVFDTLFNLIDKGGNTISLTNENIPLEDRAKLAQAFFDPKNRALLQEFSGNGQNNLYARLTKGDVTDVMEQLGKKDPTLWGNYKDFVTSSFSNVIFRKEIAGLKEIENIPGAKLVWNTDNTVPKWELAIGGNKSAMLTKYGGVIQDARQSLNRLNYGIAQVWDTLSRDKEPVDQYLLSVFGQHTDLLQAGGLPESMVKALTAEANQRKLERQQREESSRQR